MTTGKIDKIGKTPNSNEGSGLEAQFQTQHEFIKAAKMKLNPMIWDYLVGATETETTLRRNRAALDAIALRPRVLRDVSKIDLSSTFLGSKRNMRLPVMLAPVGSLESFDPEGGINVAKAAAQFGVPLILSSVTTQEMEPVRAAADGYQIFQLYVRGDDAWIDERVKRAVNCGFDAFCITVDTAVYSRRERDIAKRFAKPWRQNLSGTQMQAALSWKNVEHFKKTHKIPLILKGIGTAEDARLAVEHGVEVVYVSNHGGRQLDHGRGSMDVLPEVLDAIGGKARVIVDGSISRGTDVVKAIAMGADAVAVGRLFCYALAAAGQAGVVRMLEILEEEMISAMGLTGVTKLKDLDRSYLHMNAPLVAQPHVHSAFPLLNLDDEGYGGR
jgi:isopentenyl diphosphate isomerase/L-lactate dehydrogenase-like FMN-dependent dehydrogenase